VGSSSERTRTAITAALRKKLKDLMGEFQDLRQRLQDEYRCRRVRDDPSPRLWIQPRLEYRQR
jgi:hypothetical protein